MRQAAGTTPAAISEQAAVESAATHFSSKARTSEAFVSCRLHEPSLRQQPPLKPWKQALKVPSWHSTPRLQKAVPVESQYSPLVMGESLSSPQEESNSRLANASTPGTLMLHTIARVQAEESKESPVWESRGKRRSLPIDDRSTHHDAPKRRVPDGRNPPLRGVRLVLAPRRRLRASELHTVSARFSKVRVESASADATQGDENADTATRY